jgi:hypothetical protein
LSRSSGSSSSVRAMTANIPSPTFASPLRTRAVYACERPIRAANPRSDKARSVFMTLSRYASANVKWLGAASATAADGVLGARLAFTAVGSPKKFNPSSPYHKNRCRTNRPVAHAHSLPSLSAFFAESVVHQGELIHTPKFRFFLTSDSGEFFPAISRRCGLRLLPNGRISPTKRTERLLPNGRASPTKRTGAKNPRRYHANRNLEPKSRNIILNPGPCQNNFLPSRCRPRRWLALRSIACASCQTGQPRGADASAVDRSPTKRTGRFPTKRTGVSYQTDGLPSYQTCGIPTPTCESVGVAVWVCR